MASPKLQCWIRPCSQGAIAFHVADMLRSIMATCCLGCNKIKFVGNKTYLTKFHDTNASVIMPIETSKSSTQFFGRDFVYFLEVPGVSFLLKPKRHSASELTADLFKSVLSTWPLFITALLMAIIAGIAIWMMVSIQSVSTFVITIPQACNCEESLGSRLCFFPQNDRSAYKI